MNFLLEYIYKIKLRIKFQIIIWIGLFITIFGAVVGIRKVFITPYSYYFGEYSDFLTQSIYLIDIGLFIIFLGLFIACFRKHILNFSNFKIWLRSRFNVAWETKLLSLIILFGLFQVINLVFSSKDFDFINNIFTAAVFLFILSLFLVLRGKFSVFSPSFGKLLLLIGLLGVFEGILVIVQFYIQSNLGLPFHMEPVFGFGVKNVSVISTVEGLFFRPYGTFVHPNILAGFLFLSYVCLTYLYLYSDHLLSYTRNKYNLTKYIILLFNLLVLSAFCLTFSRTAFFALLVFFLSLSFLAYLFVKSSRKKVLLPILYGFVVLLTVMLILWPINVKRIPNWQENAITERLTYNQIGIEALKSHWLLGVGIGKSLLIMPDYYTFTLKPWEHQPIHNYFLIFFLEWGILPFLAFLGYLVLIAYKLFIKMRVKQSLSAAFALSFLFALVVLMMGDHYLYTLRPGQILFWGSLLVLDFMANHASGEYSEGFTN